jgi:hypothetical protein
MYSDISIWGPHYWFFIHCIAFNYPKHPNSITQKKYYDFFYNLPLFIPNLEIANNFVEILKTWPITPYLDSRDNLLKWTHFIHNKINEENEKKTITFNEFLEKYTSMNSIDKNLKQKLILKKKKFNYIFIVILFILILLAFKLFKF